MKTLSLLAILATTLSTADGAILRGSFTSVPIGDNEYPSRWEIQYDAATGEASNMLIDWIDGINHGVCGSGPATGFVDPVSGQFDVSVDGLLGGEVQECSAFDAYDPANMLDSFRVSNVGSDQLFWTRDLSRYNMPNRTFEYVADWRWIDYDAIPGDANGDGAFDSSDLVQVFAKGAYELTHTPAGDPVYGNVRWEWGDWNADDLFDSSDLVAAFVEGKYEAAPAATAIPEPSALVLMLMGVLALIRGR